MLSNRMEWVAACSHASVAAGFGGADVLRGTAMSTSAPVAVLGARKPRITDAAYAQGDPRAWSPPV
jgi:hypothetical protein